MKDFTFSRMPKIYFGACRINMLGGIVGRFGSSALVVTGAKSLASTGKQEEIRTMLDTAGIESRFFTVTGEPSPELVDSAVGDYKDSGIDAVCAIGGGSVLDAGKAISAMIPSGEPVIDYLEGVGTGKPHDGRKVPFIAVPTTAGTGSEATKNAVLSLTGPDGFKKSLRHDNFIPDIALIDPELMLSCPPHVTAATGLDALTQLMEAYVSTNASPFTDAMAMSGLKYAIGNLIPACTSAAGHIEVRAGMAYAALQSGICLANAGLGTVHGLASVLGGMYDIPHGVVCGTVMGAAVQVTIEKLRDAKEAGNAGLNKYADMGMLMGDGDTDDTESACDLLIQKLAEWIELLRIPRLGEYGITEADIDRIAAEAGNKNNPVALDTDDIGKILRARL